MKPDLAQSYNTRAYCYLKIKDFTSALNDANAYMKLSPSDANTYDTRGDIYFAMGQLEQSITDYEQAVSLDSKFEQISGPKIEKAKEKLKVKNK